MWQWVVVRNLHIKFLHSHTDPEMESIGTLYVISIVVIFSSIIGYVAVNNPETLQGISMAGFWICVLAIALCRVKKREVNRNWLVSIMLIGLFLRIGMAFVHLAVGFWFYGGHLDFVGYHNIGVSVGRNFLQGYSGHTAIGNLLGFLYLMAGPGIVGMVLLSAGIGFLGSYLFLRAYEVEFSHEIRREKRFLVLTLFLLPTLAYWGILLGKDSWFLLFLGWASYAIANLLTRIRVRYIAGLIISIGFISLIRPPVAAVLTFAVGFAWLIKRAKKGPAALFRPLRNAIILVVIVVIPMEMFSLYFVGYKDLAEGASMLDTALAVGQFKHVGLSMDQSAGGSSLPIGITEFSAGGISRYLPYGMFTFLFRPFIFEAHHALALAAALESTILLAILLYRFKSLFAVIRCFFTRPFIAFCAITFFLLTAMLSFEANFGVIVRHRAMVLPFMLILLAVPRKNKRNGQIATSSAKADGEVR